MSMRNAPFCRQRRSASRSASAGERALADRGGASGPRSRGGRWLLVAALGIAFILPRVARAVDPTWNYAVQVSATVAPAAPWSITLQWPEDTGAGPAYFPDYTLYRKDPTATDWGPAIPLAPGQTSYVDHDVRPGVEYEYRIVRQFRDPRFPTANHDGYGYIVAGIDVPLVDHRGGVILVVEDRIASALADKVARLRRDLVGDGWTVTQLTVSAGDSPASVRHAIQGAYAAGGGQAQALFLLGHIPVVKSGDTAPDGHEPRALPCDAFYGDLDGTWTDANGDGIYDNNTIPSAVELETGRVDFSDLAGIGTGLDDIGLTARYLDKDHAFRDAQMRLAPRALIADRIGIDRGRAPAAAGYRAFTAMFGPGNVLAANTEDNAPDGARWISLLDAGTYLWTFGSGGGGPDSIAELGTGGEYKVATSTELAAGAQAGFYLLFGSYFLDWSQPDNLLRSALASPVGGLGAGWSGRPSFIMHFMAMGETVGYGVRLTQNNDGLYFCPPNAFGRGVHIAWMGDPTLRLDSVAPATGLTGLRTGSAVALSWQPSADASTRPVSYLVYRGVSPDGPFTRLTPEPIDALTFTDVAAPPGATYLVRAVALQQTASGTYQNAAEGVFWTDPAGATTAPETAPTVRLSMPLLFTPVPASEQPGPYAP